MLDTTKRLPRLKSHTHHAKDYVPASHVGDFPDKCILAIFVDAGFSGDLKDDNSTTGGYLVLTGPNIFASFLCIDMQEAGASITLKRRASP